MVPKASMAAAISRSPRGMTDTFTQCQQGMADPFTQGQEFSDDYDQEEENDVHIDGETLFADELTQQSNVQKKRRQSIQMGSYIKDEDKFIGECWKDIGQDLKIGAEQKGSTSWLRVHAQLRERKKFQPYKFVRKCGWVSI
ncbi:Lectin-domain containing receptor kinase A4.3 [Hordeum vulgare]|nr:Lectin-domain containing receptor kinase A4.3 [Hordeum vulgare]